MPNTTKSNLAAVSFVIIVLSTAAVIPDDDKPVSSKNIEEFSLSIDEGAENYRKNRGIYGEF